MQTVILVMVNIVNAFYDKGGLMHDRPFVLCSLSMSSVPLFSVVVPTYNRPERLASCLAALVEQDYLRDRIEVVIVDDGSPMPMDSVVNPFESKLSVTLIRQKNAGPAAARNAGAKQAKGTLLAFTDDDCMPSTDWLSGFADRLRQTPDAMVGGRSLNALPNNSYSTASQALIDYLYSYYGGSERSAAEPSDGEQMVFFASNNIAMARENYLSVGGFDTSFPLAAAEDRELCDRWQHQGLPMVYAPEVTIRHAHHLSLQSFWKQHFGYGRGAFCFHQVRSQRNEEPIRVEPVKFYTDLLTYPLSRKDVKSPLFVSGLFFLSQVATTAGFFWERMQSRPLSNKTV